MSVSNDFLEYIFDQFSAWGGVSARRMIGRAGLYRDGKIFGLVADNVAYFVPKQPPTSSKRQW
jgi:DNA transformation protein and related proteins